MSDGPQMKFQAVLKDACSCGKEYELRVDLKGEVESRLQGLIEPVKALAEEKLKLGMSTCKHD